MFIALLSRPRTISPSFEVQDSNTHQDCCTESAPSAANATGFPQMALPKPPRPHHASRLHHHSHAAALPIGSLRLLVMLDEFTRECLAIRVARRLNSARVIELMGDCMLAYGVPEHVNLNAGRHAGRHPETLRTCWDPGLK